MVSIYVTAHGNHNAGDPGGPGLAVGSFPGAPVGPLPGAPTPRGPDPLWGGGPGRLRHLHRRHTR